MDPQAVASLFSSMQGASTGPIYPQGLPVSQSVTAEGAPVDMSVLSGLMASMSGTGGPVSHANDEEMLQHVLSSMEGSGKQAPKTGDSVRSIKKLIDGLETSGE